MSTCRQPGCTGTIEEGYCDLCGHAAAPAQPPAQTPQTGHAPHPGHMPPAGPVSGNGGPSTGGPATGPSIGGPATSPSTGRPVTGPASSGRSRAGVLAELADLPSVPYRDPQSAVLADPEVPEDKRFCSNPACEQPIGRSRQGRPGLTDGFCPHCRTPFSFTPKLAGNDLVAGQYRVLGCLAHGGLGWIYLAADENLDGRWVVLKGLLNTADAEALAAAEAERRFLTTVDHPNIVKIFNFQRSAGLGYIVMEYVGGQSLHELRRQGTLPLREVLMYGREILRAFAYLHEQGLVYCDLKPANVIRVGRRLKLIDLGAVQRIGSPPGSGWATPGYHAPELDSRPSSVTSDLYTVGRTLAVLAVPGFSPARNGVEMPLPDDCGDTSFTRLLRRATAADPADRFQSAEEMEAQLVGVLREVSALADGVPYPAPSALFGPERIAAGAALSEDPAKVFDALDPRAAAAALPVPLADPADPAAGALAGLVGRDPAQLVAQVTAMPTTPETLLTRARLLAEQALPEAGQAVDEARRALPGDWRVTWYEAVHALARGLTGEAVTLFDRCVSLLPGECAPKLGLAFALESERQDPVHWYERVWRVDRAFVSAAFGLARAGRAEALDEVPASSSHWVAAQLAAVASVARPELRPGLRARPGAVTPAELSAAADRLDHLADLDPRRRDAMTAEVLRAALTWLDSMSGPPQGVRVAGADFTVPAVRRRLEEIYRRLAAGAESRRERRELVDRANAVRPWTWV
ncbi:serine/threonine-protein kinase [Nonomuraea indica]|uniref:serine/threonine-protein kinase n=1 Tax=Nonomuraea indica TaxID=1581193 RepID=UPI000C7A8A66|nr:serine/threonine-protein kinase [Nonomuraea indica]